MQYDHVQLFAKSADFVEVSITFQMCKKKASQADEVAVDKAGNENAERFFI